MNPTDIIERLVSQLDDEIATGYEAVSLLERARDQLIEFTNLPARLVDTLADELGIVSDDARAGLSVSRGPVTVTVNHPAIEAAIERGRDTAPPPPAPAAPSTRQKYPLSQVAEIWHSFPTAKPGARYKAIAMDLGITIKAAQQAVLRARLQGLIAAVADPRSLLAPPVEVAAPSADFDPDAIDWEAVAACYKLAVTQNRRPIDTIAIEFDVPRHVAKDWPTVCRRLGLLPPADQPQVETDRPRSR